jgi:stearoyl-CoA desaturase (delta-9 desaturase)
MLGESLHNNHHKHPRPNFGDKWYEFDPVYPVILLLNKLKVIRLKRIKTLILDIYTQIQYNRVRLFSHLFY